MKIIIAGGTGFIGSALTHRLLNEHHSVVLLTRNPLSVKIHHHGCLTEQWDASSFTGWEKHLNGADAVINLTGELIAGKRWSPAQKRKILESRVNATRIIVSALRQAKTKPSVLVNASAVGYYGDVPFGDVTEQSPMGNDFLAEVCKQWEQSALAAGSLNIRVVTPRFGVVLEKNGGALPKLMLPFKIGAGGWLGSGNQWFPWIHLDDIVGSLIFAIQNQNVVGAYNATAPGILSMKAFCKQLATILNKPAWAPVPAFVLRFALGEMSRMLLTGQRAVPRLLLDSDYQFIYPEAGDALRNILKKELS